MRHLILFLILFSALVSLPSARPRKKINPVAPSSAPVSPPDSTADSTPNPVNQRIKKVLFDSDRLWILALDGTLTTLDLKLGTKEVVAPDKLVFDIYRGSAKQLYLLGGASLDSRQLHVWQKTATSWTTLAEIQRDGRDAVLGLKEYRDGLLVLTQRKIYLQDRAGSARTVQIKKALPAAYQTPFAVTDDGYIYLGINQGEWGGGLIQVSIDSGEVKGREQKDKPDPCAGPLNPDCDPVTGVIRDPADSSCVIASIGLRHFMEQGRLIRVCKESVSVVFSKSYAEEDKTKSADQQFEEHSTEAIFDLVPGENDYWAVTGRRVYHFTPGSEPTFHAIPKLRTLSGINLNDEITNIIVVSTDINWAKSLSGYTPLIALKN
jgi:hypothetical protein